MPGVGLVVSGIFTVPDSPALRAWSWPVSWLPPRVAVTLMPVSSLSPELVIWMSISCESDGTLLVESGRERRPADRGGVELQAVNAALVVAVCPVSVLSLVTSVVWLR